MKLRYLVSTAVLTLVATVAYAGLIQPAPIMVDLDNMFAQGDQMTARTAEDDVSFIGCGVRVLDDGIGGTFSFGFCQAGDSEEVEAFCSTQRADMLDAMKSSSAFAFITFGWDANGECTRIGFSAQSFYLPNFTTKGKN